MIQTIEEMEELFPEGRPGSEPTCDCESKQQALEALQGWSECLELLRNKEAEVERLKLIADQATRHMELDGTDVVINKPFVGFAMIGYKFEIPELHDYLQENK